MPGLSNTCLVHYHIVAKVPVSCWAPKKSKSLPTLIFIETLWSQPLVVVHHRHCRSWILDTTLRQHTDTRLHHTPSHTHWHMFTTLVDSCKASTRTQLGLGLLYTPSYRYSTHSSICTHTISWHMTHSTHSSICTHTISWHMTHVSDILQLQATPLI